MRPPLGSDEPETRLFWFVATADEQTIMVTKNNIGVAATTPLVNSAVPEHVRTLVPAFSSDTETIAALMHTISAAAAQSDARLRRIEELLELLPLLLAMAGVDPTHVPIEVAAIALGVSVPTIRRKIRKGDLRLDVIAGTKTSGIPLEDLYGLWIPLRIARAALARERAALDSEKKEPRLQEARARIK